MNKKVLVFTAIGFECVGLVAACVLIGRWLDAKYGWNSMGSAMGAIIGVVAWVMHLLVLLRQLNKDDDQPENSESK
jgi:hypothetical protein